MSETMTPAQAAHMGDQPMTANEVLSTLQGNLAHSGLEVSPTAQGLLNESLTNLTKFVARGAAPATYHWYNSRTDVFNNEPASTEAPAEVTNAVTAMLGAKPNDPEHTRVEAYDQRVNNGRDTRRFTRSITPTPLGPTVVETIGHNPERRGNPRSQPGATRRLELFWRDGADPYDVPKTGVL